MAKTDKFVEIIKASGFVPTVIYDVGCFDAKQAIELYEAFPKATVFAFECDPAQAEVCQKAVDGTRVRFVSVALSNNTGKAAFFQSAENNREIGSMLEPIGNYIQPCRSVRVLVDATRADDLIKSGKAMSPDVIWIDVQGFEINALMGFGEFLSVAKFVWSEVHYSQFYLGQLLASDFNGEMEKLGFVKCYEVETAENWFGDSCYKRIG
jgi:FkbM family methyltransferase